MSSVEPYDESFNEESDEFHSVFTIQMGELIHDKLIDFNDGTWDTLIDGTNIAWYNDEQKKRFWGKFTQHYYWQEIGELPFKRWKCDLLAKIAELMPKYCLLYKILDKNIDPMQIENEYGKNRNIFSEFPQTMLGNNEDYASTGNDNQFENIKDGGFVDMVKAIESGYVDPDAMLIKELSIMFYNVFTANVNGW